MPAVFSKNTAAVRTAAAKKIEAHKESDCTGLDKYLANCIASANYPEIDEWYADQDDYYEEE